ncbi:sigma factor-like helix-turn-helix DNA-binding protein, partial [Acinetobacter baumannii]
NCARTWANDRLRDRARCESLDDPVRAEGHQEREAEPREFCDPDALTPEAAIMRDADAAFLRRAIETLPGDFREVLVLREFEDLSYRAIAEI